ncbi:hypothetical protein KDA_57010 [Dictyobacter alpinus]|uniref:Methyltransferase domain-containing protein n=1 Tax=Dictyobacter alpinus TaxID=2014873 RepID=A0A402BG24_9CHLR|nr:class I SAM-dependent methyltransferase [Dictyobacter alpinus]GCE30217.1 hypothetical protein KDA_57010 [Dictyobacter alpinus]
MSWFPFRKQKSTQQGKVTAKEESQPIEVILQGRRYRQDVPYVLPKDLGEINRLDFQHHLLKQAIKTNHIASISHITEPMILDVGCGTGRWVLEMGKEFPQAQVNGLDVEIPLVAQEMQEANCAFVVGNVLKGLPFPDNTFDYVHQRFLASALPANEWPRVLKELMRVTKPGGWIELVELLHRVEPLGVAGKQMSSWIEQFCAQRGIQPAIGENLADLLAALPELKEQQVYHYDLPVGTWGGHGGQLLAKSHLSAYAGVKPIYVEKLQVNPANFDAVYVAMLDEWEKAHAYSRCYFAIAKKQ